MIHRFRLCIDKKWKRNFISICAHRTKRKLWLRIMHEMNEPRSVHIKFWRIFIMVFAWWETFNQSESHAYTQALVLSLRTRILVHGRHRALNRNGCEVGRKRQAELLRALNLAVNGNEEEYRNDFTLEILSSAVYIDIDWTKLIGLKTRSHPGIQNKGVFSTYLWHMPAAEYDTWTWTNHSCQLSLNLCLAHESVAVMTNFVFGRIKRHEIASKMNWIFR